MGCVFKYVHKLQDLDAFRSPQSPFVPKWKLPLANILDILLGNSKMALNCQLLEQKGVPSVVERTLIRPPASQLGPISASERHQVIAGSPVAGKYDQAIDRISAHEILLNRANRAAQEVEEAGHADEEIREFKSARRYRAGGAHAMGTGPKARARRGENLGVGQALGQAIVKELAGTTGRRIIRGILGGLFKAR